MDFILMYIQNQGIKNNDSKFLSIVRNDNLYYD